MTPAQRAAAAKKPRKCSEPSKTRSMRKYPWICLLREKRQALRLSLRDVALGAGLSIAGLSMIELGTDPQLTTARTLATFFGVSVEELWPRHR